MNSMPDYGRFVTLSEIPLIPASIKTISSLFCFINNISDIYESKVADYTQQYKGDKERIKRRLKREPFVLNDKCTFNSIFKNRNKDNIGQIINGVFHDVGRIQQNQIT